MWCRARHSRRRSSELDVLSRGIALDWLAMAAGIFVGIGVAAPIWLWLLLSSRVKRHSWRRDGSGEI